MKRLAALIFACLALCSLASFAREFLGTSTNTNIEECLATDPNNYFGMTMVFVFDSQLMSKEDVLTVLNKFEEYDIPFSYRYMNGSGSLFKFEAKAASETPVKTAQEQFIFKNLIRAYVNDVMSLRGLDSFRCEYRQSPAVTGNN